jgi:hypothetical protein
MGESLYKRVAIAVMTPDELAKFCETFGESDTSNFMRLRVHCCHSKRVEIEIDAKKDGFDLHVEMFEASLRDGMLREWKEYITMTL